VSSTHAGFAYAGPGGPVVFTFRISSKIHLKSRDRFEGVGQLEICDKAFGDCHPAPGLAKLSGSRLECS
jgi:hypothetical protein